MEGGFLEALVFSSEIYKFLIILLDIHSVNIEQFAEIVGVIGALTYVASYAILQYHRDFAKSIYYTLMNIAACLMVLYSVIYYWSFASAIIQISWLLIIFMFLSSKF